MIRGDAQHPERMDNRMPIVLGRYFLQQWNLDEMESIILLYPAHIIEFVLTDWDLRILQL